MIRRAFYQFDKLGSYTDVYHLLRVGSDKYPVLFNRLQCVDIQAIIRLLDGYFMIFLFFCLQSRRIFLNLQIIKNNSSIVATIALHINKAFAFIPVLETSTLS